MAQRQALDRRTKLLDAAQNIFRAKGYTATTVDDICAAAGVTKGSFFHHFKSKEDLTLAAARYWNEWTSDLFAASPYHDAADPRDRLLGYVDFRSAILDRDVQDFTCLLGTLVQETYQTHPAIRSICDAGMSAHIESLIPDIAAAKAQYAPTAEWTPDSVGYFIQAVLQGSFIYAKTKESAGVAKANLAHLHRYLEILLPLPNSN